MSKESDTGRTRALVVIVRGWTNTNDALVGVRRFFSGFGRRSAPEKRGGDLPQSFVQFVEGTLGERHEIVMLAPNDLEMGMFSTEDPESVLRELFRRVSDAVRQHQPEVIYLVGYSAGTLLARALFCTAHGHDCGAGLPKELNDKVQDWASRIVRVIYLSPITRGWELSSATPTIIRAVGPLLLSLIGLRSHFRRNRCDESQQRRSLFESWAFISKMKRGSPFVTLTQLQFLAVHRRLESQEKPLFVYLLGSQDEFVSPADAMDYGPRDRSVFLEVPHSNHLDLLDVVGDRPEAVQRAEILRRALLEDQCQLEKCEYFVRNEDTDDYIDELDRPQIRKRSPQRSGETSRPPSTEWHDEAETREEFPEVEWAVMIVHGIRDNGFWTKRVARAVRRLGERRGLDVRAPSPSYGFFSAREFLRLSGRLAATYWFMERFVQIRAVYPNARISFIGHSNGTLLAARAMELCEAIRFDHVVFAGSVVRSNFDWSKVLGPSDGPGVKSVLNVAGSRDMVVRMLPGLSERLGLGYMRFGGAGYFGFLRSVLGDTGRVEQRQVRGGHGAAISEDYWDRLAMFALDGDPRNVSDLPPIKARSPLLSLAWDLAIIGVGAWLTWNLIELAWEEFKRLLVYLGIPDSIPLGLLVSLVALYVVRRMISRL